MWVSVALSIGMTMMLAIAGDLGAAVQPRTPSVRVVESIDLARYAGQWFEIARLANPLQSKCVADATSYYGRRSDGRIDVINKCKTAAGAVIDLHGITRKVTKGTSDARWQVRYAPPIRSIFGGAWTDYWILGLGPDYTWAVAGSPSRDRLWILSRTPAMSTESYERAIAVAMGNGFDVSRLIKTEQILR